MAARPFNVISLCTGGAGLDHGFRLAVPFARSVCLVEREAYAVRRLVATMEDGLLDQAPIWSDVTTFRGRPWRGLVDGLIGGIPCQPHSLAGKRQGSDDERDLWTPTRRIIVQARPRLVLIENVAGMLSAGDDEVAGADRVRRDLLKLGYEVEGGLFTAAEVGFSHLRPRVFILGLADAQRDRRRQGADLLQPWAREPQPARQGEDLADTDVALLRGQPPARQQLEHERNDGPRAGASGKALVDAYLRGEKGKPRDLRAPAGADRAGEERHPRDAGSVLVDAVDSHSRGRPDQQERRARGRATAGRSGAGDDQPRPEIASALPRSGYLADTNGDEPSSLGGNARALRRFAEREGGSEHGAPLFGGRGFGYSPPGPGDLDAWRAILAERSELSPATAQPDLRPLADGLGRSRIDELRLGGNGVVPLVAAYAIRTLAARLARRGAAGADELVRMTALSAIHPQERAG